MVLEVQEKKKLLSAESVFEEGSYKVTSIEAEVNSKALLITYPVEAGQYPVMIFFHGFILDRKYYTGIFNHIASYGYIIAAPQLYTLTSISEADQELESAAAVINWLSIGLQSELPQQVIPKLDKIILAGHSRGGRAAFAIALGLVQTSQEFSAVIGVDPVAGTSKENQLKPHVLTYVDQSFDINAPILVIGTGLGDVPKICCAPSCAPEGVNHEEFFAESKKPCYHFVAKEYGHMDMLNDDPKPPKLMGFVNYCMCTNGKNREPMRKFVGGTIVAFLEAYLDKKQEDLTAIVKEPSIAPVVLGPPEYRR